jgi:hypothetical protein
MGHFAAWEITIIVPLLIGAVLVLLHLADRQKHPPKLGDRKWTREDWLGLKPRKRR